MDFPLPCTGGTGGGYRELQYSQTCSSRMMKKKSVKFFFYFEPFPKWSLFTLHPLSLFCQAETDNNRKHTDDL